MPIAGSSKRRDAGASTAVRDEAAAAERKKQFATRFKTELCKSHQTTGACDFPKCVFAHGDSQLRTVAQNEADGIVNETAIRAWFRQQRQEMEAVNQQASSDGCGAAPHLAYAKTVPPSLLDTVSVTTTQHQPHHVPEAATAIDNDGDDGAYYHGMTTRKPRLTALVVGASHDSAAAFAALEQPDRVRRTFPMPSTNASAIPNHETSRSSSSDHTPRVSSPLPSDTTTASLSAIVNIAEASASLLSSIVDCLTPSSASLGLATPPPSASLLHLPSAAHRRLPHDGSGMRVDMAPIAMTPPRCCFRHDPYSLLRSRVEQVPRGEKARLSLQYDVC